ncbi:hypothetical protein, partial [Streptomyces sp. NRRL S-495]|uniref:hypothetical protein n=1 Tax=Streptomyces sp. NRRL S-495 TaxID=1609133 RepID=UPI000B33A29E
PGIRAAPTSGGATPPAPTTAQPLTACTCTASTTATSARPRRGSSGPPSVDNYFRLLSLFTKNADTYGTTAVQPDVDLLAAIERLIHRDTGTEADGTDGIAGLPDQGLVDTLSAFTNRR